MALIYIVEDDPGIREIETIALKNSNYSVAAFDRASSFFQKIGEVQPDLVLLDIMLPDESGFDVLKKLRGNPVTEKIPVIMVTAKTAELDMVRGLDGGADDYIRKPFSLMELLSRIRAVIRRTAEETPGPLQCGGIILDQERHSVSAAGVPVELTFKEFELLRYLMLNEDIVLSRDAIMRSVWGTDYEGESRTVDMHIKSIRQKLLTCGSRIRTVRNVGYVISGREAET